MTAGARMAGEKNTCGTAELRKDTAADASGTRRTGQQLPKNCGKTAEQLRKLSSVPDLALTPSDPAQSAEAPGLVQGLAPKMPREVTPAEAPKPRGEFRCGDAVLHTIAKRGRAWAVHDPTGELVALVLYRKGAAEVVRRLDAGTEARP